LPGAGVERTRVEAGVCGAMHAHHIGAVARARKRPSPYVRPSL
jgi:hypothetical protein